MIYKKITTIFFFLIKVIPMNSQKEVYIFWHIYINPKYLEKCTNIITRQYEKIKNSGLLQRCTCIYIGYVGTIPFPIDEILNNKKIKILIQCQKGFEGVTTTILKKFCDENSHNFDVLYIHNRGSTRIPNSPTDDWTIMMEYFCIDNWEKAVNMLKKKLTAGCEMWPHRVREETIMQKHILCPLSLCDTEYHYSGNFWWARSDYIRLLKYPTFKNRYEESEDWILQLANKGIDKTRFGILHRTSLKRYESGMINHYIDRYPIKYYKKAQETPDIEIDKNLCNEQHCHGPYGKIQKLKSFTISSKLQNFSFKG